MNILCTRSMGKSKNFVICMEELKNHKPLSCHYDKQFQFATILTPGNEDLMNSTTSTSSQIWNKSCQMAQINPLMVLSG